MNIIWQKKGKEKKDNENKDNENKENEKKDSNNYILCLTNILTGSSINFFFKHYNINKELNFTYKLESLENNTAEKPEIQKSKEKLTLKLGNKDERNKKTCLPIIS